MVLRGGARTVRCVHWKDNSSDTATDTSEMVGLPEGNWKSWGAGGGGGGEKSFILFPPFF